MSELQTRIDLYLLKQSTIRSSGIHRTKEHSPYTKITFLIRNFQNYLRPAITRHCIVGCFSKTKLNFKK